jgi:hypothetical protein
MKHHLNKTIMHSTLVIGCILAGFVACSLFTAENIAFPAVQSDTTLAPKWERNQKPILQNFNNMYQPCVVEVGGGWRYRMRFFGWASATGNPGVPGCDAIFHGRSKDLESWEVYSQGGTWDKDMNPEKWIPVLYASDRWFEEWHVGDPSVVMKNGKFYMAYSATSRPFAKKIAGYPADMVQCVMGAVSEDGIHWRKTDEPLLIHPGDSDTPQPEPDRIGDFHRPSLLWLDGKWRLYFDYWLPSKGVCLGYAENTGDFMQKGGFKIKHDLKQPLMENWPNPEVIRIGNTFHCFGDPVGYPIKPGESGWKSRQLREAISSDGLLWEKLDFIPPDEDADACHVPQALVTTINGNKWLYLFYSTQIGYKKNDSVYHFQYDRIQAMRRPVGKSGEAAR